MSKSVELYHDDCFNIFPQLEDKSIDMVLVDLPYGTTHLKWDNVIDMDKMWGEVKRVIKPRGAVVMFGSQPFTSLLINSNLEMYKYSWIWRKKSPSNFVQANVAPLKMYEDIAVFSHGLINPADKHNRNMYYNPQGLVRQMKKIRRQKEMVASNTGFSADYVQKYTGYPKNILEYPHDYNKHHPTVKPVALLEYLIKTYTLEGETVLDFTMGSGSTGVAARNTGRSFIGVEKQTEYFKTAQERIDE